ncbi:MAG: 3-phosphoserine/phosphohydroxythreonine transaminase [Pirellulales bacterium]|nr:3-phosphoserine/phosphohydroxythreonine transaminase [Pirellulales bacterium]
MADRIYNFSPGPAMLPLAALEEAQRDLQALPGTGISILEISHRSKAFEAIINEAEANLRKLLGIPDRYRVLFLQGGALLQFAMVPMNLLRGQGKSADYILTGSWAKKAMQEAKTQGGVRVAWDGSSGNFKRMPSQNELDIRSGATYVHMTSNETIQGIQFPNEPNAGNVPLVCDSSSDFLCRPLDISKYGILYACAQKNAGPAGVTVVIIRDDVLQSMPTDLPSMLNYRELADSKSLLNTPPTFAVYMVKLVTDWLLRDIGGLDEMHRINKQKAEMLYGVIDQCGGFYDGHAEPASRSIMNVTFRLPNAELEEKFLKEAKSRGLVELKGHRSVGGCRASIYNAMPVEGVQSLRDCMLEFHDRNKPA